MASMVVLKKEIAVRHTVDVFVAGGGPAGCAAAVAAARQGLTVFLAESQFCLGGMGTAGLVPCYMQFGDGVHFLADGIGREIYTTLYELGGCGGHHEFQEVPGFVPIRAEVLKRVYDRLLQDAGVQFAFGTQLIDVMTRGERVESVICAAKSGLFAVQAKIYIDGTGDGDLAAWAGAPFEKGDENGNVMPGTLCSLWTGINWPKVSASKYHPDDCRILDAIHDGVLTVEDRHLPGMFPLGPGEGGGNIGHAFGVDGTDERSLTQAMLEQRQRLLEYERYYKEYLEGFEAMNLVATGALPGIRESRRILGDYVLQVKDFESRAVFPDEIGRYAYPVDIHPAVPNAQTYAVFYEEITKRYHYAPGESYGIPYRILTPQKLDNVLVAGRCVSTDRYLQGSLRVMPGCYIMGQAAGAAAKLALEHGGETRAVPIAQLQQKLKQMGAYLPNA